MEGNEAHANRTMGSNDGVADAPAFPVGFGRSRGELAGVFARGGEVLCFDVTE